MLLWWLSLKINYGNDCCKKKKMKTNYTDAGSYDQPNAFHSLRLKSDTKSLIQISSLLRDVCSIISKGCFYLRV